LFHDGPWGQFEHATRDNSEYQRFQWGCHHFICCSKTKFWNSTSQMASETKVNWTIIQVSFSIIFKCFLSFSCFGNFFPCKFNWMFIWTYVLFLLLAAFCFCFAWEHHQKESIKPKQPVEDSCVEICWISKRELI